MPRRIALHTRVHGSSRRFFWLCRHAVYFSEISPSRHVVCLYTCSESFSVSPSFCFVRRRVCLVEFRFSCRSSLEEPEGKKPPRVTTSPRASPSVQRECTHWIAAKYCWHERRERSNGPCQTTGRRDVNGIKKFRRFDLSYTRRYSIPAEPTPVRFHTLAVFSNGFPRSIVSDS